MAAKSAWLKTSSPKGNSNFSVTQLEPTNQKLLLFQFLIDNQDTQFRDRIDRYEADTSYNPISISFLLVEYLEKSDLSLVYTHYQKLKQVLFMID